MGFPSRAGAWEERVRLAPLAVEAAGRGRGEAAFRAECRVRLASERVNSAEQKKKRSSVGCAFYLAWQGESIWLFRAGRTIVSNQQHV